MRRLPLTILRQLFVADQQTQLARQILLAIVIVCRASYFDRWDWPLWLLLLLGLNSAYAIAAALYRPGRNG